MNNTLNFIWSRRSCRAFTTEPVTDAQIQTLLKAAMAAPSACCKDPWEFIILRQPETCKAVANCLPNGPFLATAPLGIIVCGNIKRAHAESLSYLLQDCSAAIQNMLLAANAIGLGSCWLGIHPREERIDALKKVIDIPADCIPIGAIAIGIPTTRPEPRTRFDAQKVHDTPNIPCEKTP